MNQIEPVSQEDLAQLRQLNAARQQLSEGLLHLEEEKIRILAAAKRNRDAYLGCFARLAKERGLDPDAVFDIDPSNGRITVTPVPVLESDEPASESDTPV